MASEANAEAIEAWNTVLFEKFSRFRHIVTAGLGGHGEAALRSAPPSKGARVLDLGCGFGDTTVSISKLIGDAGRAHGVDAARNFIDAAVTGAEESGVANVSFAVADVQGDDLGGPYDYAFSRFGMMFFASPVAAFRNVRRVLASSGQLAMVVWRKREDNAWLHAAEVKVRELVEEPEETDQPTCGPGPFSMAGADMVSDQLRAAGFMRPRFERFDTEILIGENEDEAVEFALALGPAGEILRLAAQEAEKLKPRIVAAVREALAPYVRPEGVFAPSSSWIVRADAP